MFSKLLSEAAGNLLLHKTRSLLAALGIIFGVASVICMISISEVARRDAIGRIERLGIRNVILDSVPPQSVRARRREQARKNWWEEYGIREADLQLLRDTIGPGTENPAIERIVPMRLINEEVVVAGDGTDVGVVATSEAFTEVIDVKLQHGRFLRAVDQATLGRVCVLGAETVRELFPLANPIGQQLEIGNVHFTVVGVLEALGRVGTSGALSNPDRMVWIPYETARARFGLLNVRRGSGVNEAVQVEVDRAIIQVAADTPLTAIEGLVRHLVTERHTQDDVTITIPYALLREQRQAERIFRWVMGSLGAISLLVGGVGIMNIMLANMAERRQEIGLRRALGARRSDIVRLFMAESMLLCIIGGLFGAALGAGLAMLVGNLAQWTVAFEAYSFPLAILVSAATGLIFGTAPAVQAARVDPVLALRVE